MALFFVLSLRESDPRSTRPPAAGELPLGGDFDDEVLTAGEGAMEEGDARGNWAGARDWVWTKGGGACAPGTTPGTMPEIGEDLVPPLAYRLFRSEAVNEPRVDASAGTAVRSTAPGKALLAGLVGGAAAKGSAWKGDDACGDVDCGAGGGASKAEPNPSSVGIDAVAAPPNPSSVGNATESNPSPPAPTLPLLLSLKGSKESDFFRVSVTGALATSKSSGGAEASLSDATLLRVDLRRPDPR